MNSLSSSVGMLSLLDEDDIDLQHRGLVLVSEIVDSHWTEITDYIEKLENLSGNESFEGRQLASKILSKLYFYLQEFEMSVKHALQAGKLFDINEKGNDYVDRIIEFCVDDYILLRKRLAIETKKAESNKKAKDDDDDEDSSDDESSDDDDEEDSDEDVKMEEKKSDNEDLENIKKSILMYEPIISKMMDRCLKDDHFEQMLGIGVEAERDDIVKKAIEESKRIDSMLVYCLDICKKSIKKREFRHVILQIIVSIAMKRKNPDYFMVNECLLLLGNYQKIAELLISLLLKHEENEEENEKIKEFTLIGYQIAFDLQDTAPQKYLTGIKLIINKEKEKLLKIIKSSKIENRKLIENKIFKCQQICRILDGDISVSLYVDFLYRRNFADLNILNNMKESFERNSILHSAVCTANAFMHCGTTDDKFLRRNLKWLSQATNWSKFNATASLGIIHKGQYKDSLKLLSPYLPKQMFSSNEGRTTGGTKASIYSEGGSLFGIGLIHCTHTGNTNELIKEKFKVLLNNKSTNFVIQHGCCLGLGLTGLASQDLNIIKNLKDIVLLDNAISSESAAVAIGMILVGSMDWETIKFLEKIAKSSEHEKIIRGCMIGISLICYGREEECDELIEILSKSEDPIQRYGAMYIIGLGFAGTGNEKVIKLLLSYAVSDVSNDVRRAAVINLGFLLFHTPEKLPRLITLMTESFNPHVRYGCAIALGIACSGTGNLQALELLDKLLKDEKDFVRQGCYIASSMILMQSNNNSLGGPNLTDISLGEQVKKYREEIEKVWKNRGETMSRFGAFLAAGIIDAGGRNVTICAHKNGHKKMRNIIGLSIFTHYWFWYPYINFLSLAMEPTAIIGLNYSLNMPVYQFKSSAKKSLFAYPEPVKIQEKKKKKISPLAVLSQQLQRRRRGKVEMFTPFGSSNPIDEEKKKKEKDNKEDEDVEMKEKEEEKKKEDDFQILENPARCTLAQQKFISFDVDTNYIPIKKGTGSVGMGINLLKQVKNDINLPLVKLKSNDEIDSDSIKPPKPFEYPLP